MKEPPSLRLWTDRLYKKAPRRYDYGRIDFIKKAPVVTSKNYA